MYLYILKCNLYIYIYFDKFVKNNQGEG
jgi:hypothetical protein